MREHFFWEVGLVHARYCPASRGDSDDSDVFRKDIGPKGGEARKKGRNKTSSLSLWSDVSILSLPDGSQ